VKYFISDEADCSTAKLVVDDEWYCSGWLMDDGILVMITSNTLTIMSENQTVHKALTTIAN